MTTTIETEVDEQVAVTITERAARQLKSLLEGKPDAQGKALRVYVEGGCCSGMEYGMAFDEKRDGDFATECEGLAVLVDAESAPHLRGAVVDYLDTPTDGGFKINNPNARRQCGCDHSSSCC